MTDADSSRLAPSADSWPERFLPGEMAGMIEAEHMARYTWAAQAAGDANVLDAGCGVGYGSAILKRAGAASVTGVDLSEGAIGTARDQHGEHASFVVGDLERLPFDDANFDLVTCFEAIEHVHDQDRALDELLRVMTPTGLLLISSPNRLQYMPGNPHHTHEYTPDEFEDALRSRFANVRIHRQQSWMTTMIADDEQHVAADHSIEVELSVRKLAAGELGGETFTLAAASAADLPPLRGVGMLTDNSELTAWQERAESAEHQYSSVSEHARQFEPLLIQTRADRDQTERARERAIQAANRLRTERNEQAVALHGQLMATQEKLDSVVHSLSWRITRPLRNMKRVWAARR